MTDTHTDTTTPPNVRWRESVDEAMREAKDTSKLAILDFFHPG